LLENDLEAKPKIIENEPRFDSNPREVDQDVQPLGKSEIKKKGNRNERKEKVFDLDAEEEDHKSIDSDNFGDLKHPLHQEL
jgi:hypothetical protein